MVITKDVPSIYTSLPSIPPVSSAYDPQNATHKDLDSLSSLSRLVQQGPARYILQDLLQEELEKEEEYGKYRERYERSKKRKRERSQRGWTSAEGGDDERGKSTQMDESGEEGSRMRGRPKKQDKNETKDQVNLPKQYRRHRDRVELPQNFPSGSLLASLHSHSSQLFTSMHSLLPPLTSTTPLLPPHLLTHFSQLQESLHTEEEAFLSGLKRLGQQKEVREGRIGKLGGGTRKGAWANAERGFEGSALVAIGMLTQLLVEDSLISQHAPPPSQEQGARTVAGGGEEEADADLALPIPPVASSSSSNE